MERWSGRVALVTGASVGIGAGICRALVKHGMKVVGTARNVNQIQALSQELSGETGSLTAIKCDLRKDTEVLALFSTIKKQFGGVDVCINNAGMSSNHRLLEGTPDEWREMLDVNIVSLCLCTKEAVRSMRERGVNDGQVIHISSILAHIQQCGATSHFYLATKWAVKALTEGLRQELRDLKSNIRIASISPGIVETEFSYRKNKDNPEIAKKMYSSLEALQPQDVAATVVHVLSAPQHVQIHDILMRPTEMKI
ncbi:unnamed protein product, partial [Meganyctiphanes norvegica]